MNGNLHLFPSITLQSVNKFEDIMVNHAKSFAEILLRNQKESRSESQIIENTLKGSRAKVAACLINNRDPTKMINWNCTINFNEGYTYLGEKESYVVLCKFIESKYDKIKISFSNNKLLYIINQMDNNQYSKFTEFITFDSVNETYFHLGKLSTDKFKEPIDITRYDVIFEFDISPCMEEKLLVLS